MPHIDAARLQAVQEARHRFAQERRLPPSHGLYEDVRALLRVDPDTADRAARRRSTASETATQTGVRVILFSNRGGSATEARSGLHDGVLFLPMDENGQEDLPKLPELAPGSVSLSDGDRLRDPAIHILARELTEVEIRQALREGRTYVSDDDLCDPTGFSFGAVNNLGVFNLGDAAPVVGTTRVVAMSPLAAHLKLFHDGRLVSETNGTNMTFTAQETGPYRLQAWLTVAGEERPWISAKPVYLQAPSLTDLSLPSTELAPTVVASKDVVYAAGKAEDEGKHKLDLYAPRGKAPAPVFFFIHGGAWKSGDRAQYPALANRFAREGILTVVPSYRLAPKNPHPAQIEDVAAAFAWVVRHVSDYGGDTNRLFVGGHSAGGHLAALLTLDDRYLKAHGLSPLIIRGTAVLSGVFDLTLSEGQSSVFGTDPQVRRDASPLYHAARGAAPFLISYCQWDYFSLPAQARTFYTALKAAEVPAELVFIPRESHISEMLHVPRENDPTSAAVLGFLKNRGS